MKVEITRLEVMLPRHSEIYIPGVNGVKRIYNDSDGFSIIFDDYTVRFFTNATPLKIDWNTEDE